MSRYSERSPDTYPRWALIVEPYNKIRPVLLANVEAELKKGMGRYVLIAEDDEMFPYTADEGGD